METNAYIPLAKPDLSGNELQYVRRALESTWISSSGDYLDELENRFAQVCGVEHAVACANGTGALHLALEALGIGPGDEVLVPTLTYVASVNAVAYTGATPVLVDSDQGSWNLSVRDVAASVTSRTRAIVAVHLYGNPADLDGLREVAAREGLYLVEDAAEALGASVGNKFVGSIGDVSTFSFYGNKILTTGEGGMVTTDDAELAETVRRLRGQGQDPQHRYWFPVRGFNYRLTNLQAAIGVAQLERLKDFLVARQAIAQWYRSTLERLPYTRYQAVHARATAVNWLFSITLDGMDAHGRDNVMEQMQRDGVETRPFFYPMHQMPVFSHRNRPSGFPVADALGASGVNLPTWVGMTLADVERVCDSLAEAVERQGRGDLAR